MWEIGHTSDFSHPPANFCLPGQVGCDSYDQAHWLGFTPLRIKSVTFASGEHAKQWAVVSDFGGTAEINANCSSYGGPYCIYPWYAFNGRADALTYGADYPGTRFDYGKANQFQTTPQCGGLFGPDSTYCVTIIKPVPLGTTSGRAHDGPPGALSASAGHRFAYDSGRVPRHGTGLTRSRAGPAAVADRLTCR